MTDLLRVIGAYDESYPPSIWRPPAPDPPPTVTGILPVVGPVEGGTELLISGDHLTGSTGVTFGGTAGTAFSVASALQVRVTTPAHAAGAVAVVVLNPRGNVNRPAGFTFEEPPEEPPPDGNGEPLTQAQPVAKKAPARKAK